MAERLSCVGTVPESVTEQKAHLKIRILGVLKIQTSPEHLNFGERYLLKAQ